MVDINKQAALCEELLRTDYNKHCSDCPSKIPRWASINFGVFICIRCSGKCIVNIDDMFWPNLTATIFFLVCINLEQLCWVDGTAS